MNIRDNISQRAHRLIDEPRVIPILGMDGSRQSIRTRDDSATDRDDLLSTNADEHVFVFFGVSFFCLQDLFFNTALQF